MKLKQKQEQKLRVSQFQRTHKIGREELSYLGSKDAHGVHKGSAIRDILKRVLRKTEHLHGVLVRKRNESAFMRRNNRRPLPRL